MWASRPWQARAELRCSAAIPALSRCPGPYYLRHKNTATAQFAAIQVMDSVEGGIERVNSRMHGHFALSRERHQLGQIIVGTDKVADKVDLGRDDVDGGNIERATVADYVVGTCAFQHLDCIMLRASLAYEINDGL